MLGCGFLSLAEQVGFVQMRLREPSNEQPFCWLWSAYFYAIAAPAHKCQPMIANHLLQLIKIMANRWHRNAQLVGERKLFNRLGMLKLPAQYKRLAFLC